MICILTLIATTPTQNHGDIAWNVQLCHVLGHLTFAPFPSGDILRTLNSTGVQCLVGTKSVCRNTEPLNIQRLISSVSQL